MCVLLEKPFCSTPEEASELILLAEKKNKTLMVGHCVRFAPAWEYLASRIADKTFGELKLLSFERMGGEPAWGVWQDPEIKKTCGGSMLDLLIHDIDFAGYTLGYPEEVKVNINMEEYWELELKYPGRPVKVSVKGGFLYKHTAFAVSFAATFEKGSVRYSSHQPEIIHTGSENGPGVKKLSGDAYVKEIEYFAECLLSGAKPEKCPPEDSLESLKICLETKKEASGR
jgi:predicted dehydrogenase